MIHYLTGYFSWDWPWVVVGIAAACVAFIHIFAMSLKLKEMAWVDYVLAIAFVTTLFIPFAIPFMAWAGNDFWLPLLMLWLLYVLLVHARSETSLIFLWHVAGLTIITPLAVIVRMGRYLFGW